jgi:hypothetical protein
MKNLAINLLLGATLAVQALPISAQSQADVIYKSAHDSSCGVRSFNGTEQLLQFLYKFEGNLPKINPNKIKRLDFLIDQYRSLTTPENPRRQAFKELWSDPDYWQYKLSLDANILIARLENINKYHNWERNKAQLIATLNKKAKPYDNIFYSMRDFFDTHRRTESFFNDLEESVAKLKELNQVERVAKSLPQDPEEYGFQIGLLRSSTSSLLTCIFYFSEEVIIKEWMKPLNKK